MHETKTSVLVEAMFTLARDIESQDGVANTAIMEAALRLEKLHIILDLVVLYYGPDAPRHDHDSNECYQCELWNTVKEAAKL